MRPSTSRLALPRLGLPGVVAVSLAVVLLAPRARADVPPDTTGAARARGMRVVEARVEGGSWVPRPEGRRVLVSLGAGVSTYDASWRNAGWRGALDVVFMGARREGEGALGAGVELSYDRSGSAWVGGIVPGAHAVSDISDLGVGLPVLYRIDGRDLTPYVMVVPTLTIQSLRYVAGRDAIDIDATLLTLPVLFGLERPLGPGGLFAELGYRTSLSLKTGSSVSQRGGIAQVGYHLVF